MGVLRHRAWWAAWAALAAPAALAQSGNACDQLKATLAARIEATGVRGYSLEALPAAAPLPKDGRVIGNCEGGAFKMVYRRFGGGDVAPADTAAPDKPAADKPAAPRPEPAKAVAEKPALPKPVAEKPLAEKAAAEKAAAEKPVVDKPLPPMPSPSPSPVAVAPVEGPSPAPAAPSPPSVLESAPRQPAAEAPPASDAAGGSFLPGWWPWLALGLVLPLLGWGWSRVSYRLHYDKAGLPRGPRLS